MSLVAVENSDDATDKGSLYTLMVDETILPPIVLEAMGLPCTSVVMLDMESMTSFPLKAPRRGGAGSSSSSIAVELDGDFLLFCKKLEASSMRLELSNFMVFGSRFFVSVRIINVNGGTREPGEYEESKEPGEEVG